MYMRAYQTINTPDIDWSQIGQLIYQSGSNKYISHSHTFTFYSSVKSFLLIILLYNL